MISMKALVLIAVLSCAGARAQGFSSDSLLSGVGEAMMSSLSMSSVSSMQGQFSDYLNAMDSSLMSKVSSFREMIPDLSGWNLTGFGIDTDLEKSVEKFHDKYCDGLTLKRGGKVPSVLQGPELNITLATGNCTLVWSDDYKDKSVVCTTPSVSYVKTPTKFVFKHFKASSFSVGSCVFKKELSKGSEKVLYSGGDDIIFKSSHDFQKSVQSGAFDLWGMPSHSSSNSTASADATASSSALLNLLPTDWSIIQSE